ncbi:iron complex transport system permease protein [Microbacterium halimionae]|uniref:Iron complex transport system permease protein n=1 Tax=Microbacterium halimionae TaxID=1526413 RepID=A0A7W3PKV2_9MICO|nr:iron chelate uptake ABC transporter family permease subunit [Microbacterium halimionae]MBA8815351.1 iron complex transport system permease protein [Microbacterium halimionae]NII93858.1 iron complex transport system permease protein [Microbacterium halimionae]
MTTTVSRTFAVAPIHHHRRAIFATASLAIALVLCVLIGLSVGSSSMSIGDLLRTLVGGGTSSEQLIIFDLRMPRVAGAVVIGASLAIAGALTQTFARNPLASPDILGVTSGASLGAVAAIVLAGGTYSVGAGALSIGVPLAAVLGAVVAAALIYVLAWRDGVDTYRLILIGIGLTAAFGGVTSYLIARAEISAAATAAQWLVGSLSGISWSSVWPVMIALVVVLPIALSQTKNLDISQLGDEMPVALGVSVQRHRLIVIGCAVVLTAAAVSAGGPIEFVAFVAPQIARRLGGFGRPPLVASALMGAIIVAGGDAITRGTPLTVPVGIITAIIGAPYLIWLLTRRTPKGSVA